MSISAARTYMPLNYGRQANRMKVNIGIPELRNVDEHFRDLLVKGRRVPPSAPSHRGHKEAMFTRPP